VPVMNQVFEVMTCSRGFGDGGARSIAHRKFNPPAIAGIPVAV
jgi:hypothetical protein